MGIMSKIQYWLKVIFGNYNHVGDMSRHRVHSHKYDALGK